MSDKYTATWVSHSSISDFLTCPRAYYLKNVYKDPKTNHKIQVITPPLSLGQAVHSVVESLSVLPTKDRFKESLIKKFDQIWKKVSGKNGGFSSSEQENRYYDRGKKMIQRVMNHPGPISRLAVKVDQDLPHYWLSPEDNIILCGKIDWLEYLPDDDSVHIIDFKTSKKQQEGENSLQLPIYHLLVTNTQQRKVSKASYWYLEWSDELDEKKLPNLQEAKEKILQIAKKIKLQRQLNVFKCPQGETGCRSCSPFEKIIQGKAKFIGTDEMRRDIYILPFSKTDNKTSTIL